MIRPFTCICLMVAAGSGLYLYQVKQRAFKLDAELRTTFHQIDVARERTRMLRADWALMNDPERLQALATQYLTLQPMAPAQLMTLDQLAAVLPPPEAPGTLHPPAAPPAGSPPIASPGQGMPMAAATPPAGTTPDQAVALLQPVAAAPDASAQASSAQAAGGQGAAPDAMATSSDADQTAIAVLPPPAPPPAPPMLAVDAPALVSHAVIAATQFPPARTPVEHTTRHVQPAMLIRRSAPMAHVAAAHPAPRRPHAATPQYFAANDSVHGPAMARIVPSAAAVIYRPSASALGMAGGATLAPPRPLYSTSQ